jgi:hypothetical protein
MFSLSETEKDLDIVPDEDFHTILDAYMEKLIKAMNEGFEDVSIG